MYTVMRIAGPQAPVEDMRVILKEIQRIRPDVRAEQRRRDGVVVCDISTDTSWRESQREIMRFVEDCTEPLQKAVNRGASVSVDVAIDSDEVASVPYLCVHCGTEFMQKLVELRIELEFTFYGASCSDPQDLG